MVCVSFYVICIVEILVSSVICRFQGLSYSHVPECIEFSFILFIHHNIHFYFELCTYCNILDIYLSWNMNSVKYLFIWNYWIIYFVTCLEVFWSVQCLPFYIINEVGHLTTSVDHLAEFCQNYHLAAICTQLMVKFFLQLRFIQYFDCKCMKIPDFSRIDSHFVA